MKRTEELQPYLVEKNFSQIFLLTDENTSKYCMPVLLEKIDEITDRQATLLEIPAGEENKNIQTAINLIDSLAESNADRNSCLISLGGGVVTDLGGFVSHIYKRGIQNINVPTTLLGMVDAATGGKTAIDHGGIKNLIGTFNFASEVFIDTEFLLTLSSDQIKDGLAEMIKTFLVYDEQKLYCLASIIKKYDLNKLSDSQKQSFISDTEPLIFECGQIKEHIVKQDPYDQSVRKILNFGHTLGHAVEMYYGLSHGHSVAIGIHYAIDLSVKHCGFDAQKAEKIQNMIERYYSIPDYRTDMQSLKDLMQQDKKSEDGNTKFVLLEDIGRAGLYSVEI